MSYEASMNLLRKLERAEVVHRANNRQRQNLALLSI